MMLITHHNCAPLAETKLLDIVRCDQQDRRALYYLTKPYYITGCRRTPRKGASMRAVVDATHELPRSGVDGQSPEHDPLTELLRLVEPRNLLGPESVCPGVSAPATAQSRSGGAPRGSATVGERALLIRDRRDSKLRLRPETSYPCGDHLARGALGRSPRQKDAAVLQARELAPPSPSAPYVLPWPNHPTYREAAAEDYRSANVSHPADESSSLRQQQPRVPRRVHLAIAGISGIDIHWSSRGSRLLDCERVECDPADASNHRQRAHGSRSKRLRRRPQSAARQYPVGRSTKEGSHS
jgi:hypothetical protein